MAQKSKVIIHKSNSKILIGLFQEKLIKIKRYNKFKMNKIIFQKQLNHQNLLYQFKICKYYKLIYLKNQKNIIYLYIKFLL